MTQYFFFFHLSPPSPPLPPPPPTTTIGRLENQLPSTQLGFSVGDSITLSDIAIHNCFCEFLDEKNAAEGLQFWRREPFGDLVSLLLFVVVCCCLLLFDVGGVGVINSSFLLPSPFSPPFSAPRQKQKLFLLITQKLMPSVRQLATMMGFKNGYL